MDKVDLNDSQIDLVGDRYIITFEQSKEAKVDETWSQQYQAHKTICRES